VIWRNKITICNGSDSLINGWQELMFPNSKASRNYFRKGGGAMGHIIIHEPSLMWHDFPP
jgi:hypothetical protein